MKKVLFLNVCFLLLLSVFILSCNDDKENEISETDRVNAVLTSVGQWSVQSVTVDGTDQSSLYNGLKITFTSGNYSAVNGGNVWPSVGTWKFVDESATSIVRDDGLIITIKEVVDKKLVLTLTWSKTTFGSGRASAISGQHTFTFTKP